MRVGTTARPAPDNQPNRVGSHRVQGRRSRSRSDGAEGVALDAVATDATLEQRGQALTAGELPRLLTSREVARLLVVSEPTLAHWRSEGRGPRWIEVEHRVPRYSRDDLEAWLRSRRRGDAA